MTSRSGQDISPEWLTWYGMRVGLSHNEALDVPVGELLSLIAVEQIKNEGAKLKTDHYDEDIIPDLR